mgnify:CR=1 FL=1
MKNETIELKLNQILKNQILIMEYASRETDYPHIKDEMQAAIEKTKGVIKVNPKN